MKINVSDVDKIINDMDDNEHPTLTVPSVDKVDSINEEIDNYSRDRVEEVHRANFDLNPQKEADVHRISNLYTITADDVRKRYDHFKKKEETEWFPYDKLYEKFPSLWNFLVDPTNSALAKDDLENLTQIESAARNLNNSGRDYGSLDATTVFKGTALGFTSGFNRIMIDFNNTAQHFGILSKAQAAYWNSSLYQNQKTLDDNMPEYVHNFNKFIGKEKLDVDPEFTRFAKGMRGLGDILFGYRGNTEIQTVVNDLWHGGRGTAAETAEFISDLQYHKAGFAHLVAENIPNLALTFLPGMSLGRLAPAFSPLRRLLYATGAFSGAFTMEFGSQATEEMSELGINLTDPNDLYRAYTDPQIAKRIGKAGLGKGLGTGLTDAVLSFFLLGRLSQLARGSRFPLRVLARAGDIGVDAFGEFSSEGVGQYFTGKPVSFMEMLLEGLTSLPQSTAEVSFIASSDAIKKAKDSFNITPDITRQDIEEAFENAIYATQEQIEEAEDARQEYDDDPYIAADDLTFEAKNATQSLNELNTLYVIFEKLKNSKLAKLSKEKLREALDKIFPEDNIAYFNSQEFDRYWSSKSIPPMSVIETLYDGDLERYYNQKAEGETLEIPLSNLLANIGITEHFKELIPITKIRLGSLGPREIKTFFDHFPSTFKRVAKEIGIADPDPIRTAGTRIRNKFEEQIRKTGRFGGPEVTAAGSLLESVFRSMATRTNVPLKEIEKRFDFLIKDIPDISPTKEEAESLMQKIEEVVFGVYTPRMNQITLFKNADFRTLLHELSHGFFIQMEKLALEEGVESEIYQDITGLKELVGLTEDQKITDKKFEKQHELLVKAFENYLFRGESPVSRLQRAFDLFKKWIYEAYSAFTGANIELSQEVINIFDRMIASDIEMDQAFEEIGLQDLSPEIFESRAEAALWNSLLRRWRDQSFANNRKKNMARLKKTDINSEKYRKILKSVTDEIHENKRFIAISIMANGTMPDGGKVPQGIPKYKLNREALINEFGEEILEALPQEIIARDGGVHHDTAALAYQFRNGTEMILSISYLPSTEQAIQNEISRRILAEDESSYPGLGSYEEALNSLMGKDREAILKETIKLLTTGDFNAAKKLIKGVANRKVDTSKQIKDEARKRILTSDLFRFTPNKYLLNQRKYSRLAVNALLNGDIELALAHKRREFLNYYMYKDAIAYQRELRKIPAFLKSFLKKKKWKRIAGAKFNHHQMIFSLLERFYIKDPPTEQDLKFRVPMKKWIENHAKEFGLEPIISPTMLEDTYEKPYQQLKIHEALELRDAVKSIWKASNWVRQLISAVGVMDMEEVRLDSVASIDANNPRNELTFEEAKKLHQQERDDPGSTKPPKGRKPIERESKLRGRGFKETLISMVAPLLKMSFITRMLDAHKDNGFMTRLIMNQLNQSADNKLDMELRVFKEVNRLFRETFSPDELRNLFEKESRRHYEGIGSLTRGAVLVYISNAGNVEGLERINEEGITNDQIQSLIDTLSKKERNFLNRIWGNAEQFWPQVEALSIRNDGFPPPKVLPISWKSKHGNLTGGYYPLNYDYVFKDAGKASHDENINDQFRSGKAWRATVSHSHRKERLKNLKVPIDLSFDGYFRYLREIIHDITHYESTNNVWKILHDPEISKAIIENYGEPFLEQLNRNLLSIINSDYQASQPADKFWRWIRTGQAISTMALSATTVMVQPLGLTQGMARVGPKWVLKGLGQLLGDAGHMNDTIKWIMDNSKFMNNRSANYNRESLDINRLFTVKGTTPILGDKTWSDIEASFFYFIVKAQLMADVPIWLGAYHKATEQFRTENPNWTDEDVHRESVQSADQGVIDSQGSGHIKDLASIEKGSEAWKIWTIYGSFFRTLLQNLFDLHGRTNFRDIQSVGVASVDLMLLTVIPASLEVMAKSLLRGDDEEDLIGKIAKNNLSYLLNTVPLLRELDVFFQGYGGFRGPAGARIFSDLYDLATQTKQLEADEAFFRALARTSGTLFHLPTIQAERLVRGAIALKEGETVNPFAVLMGPPSKKRKKNKSVWEIRK